MVWFGESEVLGKKPILGKKARGVKEET